MASLTNRTKRLGIALALLFGLTMFSGIAEPLVGEELASWLPGPTEVSADEPADSGG